MFYSPELLSLRRKGKLSRCWLAGTLSDRLFKKTVSNKTVLSIDIPVTCNEILTFINTTNGTRNSRFSLYTSAQLMFGAVKLFKIQACLFQDSLFRVKADLHPIDLAPRKKSRTSEITLPDDLNIEPPPVEFKNLQREDQHLLPEAYSQMLGNAAFRDYVVSPNFGTLTDEEYMLFIDGDIRLIASHDRHRRTIDKSKDQQRFAEHSTEANNLGISDALPVIEQSTNAEITAERIIITPRKRPSTEKNLDTPTKKLRQGFRQEIDAHVEERSEDVAAAFLADSEVPPHDGFAGVLPPDGFAEIPSNLEIRPSTFVEPPAIVDDRQIDESIRMPPPAQEHSVDIRVPVDSNLHLESLILDSPRPLRVRRHRIIRQIDERTVVPVATIGKSLYNNPSVYTTEFDLPVTDRKRGMLANALLLNPTTNRRCSRAADSSKWPEELLLYHEIRTMGPFVAENDISMSIEAIRLAESGMQSGLVEISKTHGVTTDQEPSSKNKTVEESIPVDNAIAEPVVPERAGNVSEPPLDMALANITDEPMLPNISKVPEVGLPPETEIPPMPQDILDDQSGTATVTYNTKLLQSDVRESVTGNDKSTSDPNTEDTDAFLPPKLRKKSVEKVERQKKSSSSEAIIEIAESVASIRSEQSDIQSSWNIPELMAYLGVLWHDNPKVKLEVLLPPDQTSKLDASVAFVLLLQLQKNRKIVLEQRNAYGTIYISKRMMASNMDFLS